MFNNKKNITIGIEERIQLDIQTFMWKCIEEAGKNGVELDYLQVFKLTQERIDDIFFQSIEHKQEIHKYSKTYGILVNGDPINEKVFVIDDGRYCTMMLEEEY